MKIPAICDTCRTLFPSGFGVEGQNIGIYECKSGPCPNCGSYGHIPDGIYSFIDNAILLLSDGTRSKEELKKLASILKKGKQKNAPTEEVSEKIQKELPALSSLKELLPKSRTDFYAFATIILSIISILINIPNSKSGNDYKPKIEINQVINLLYESHPSTHKPSDAFKKDNQLENKAETTKQNKVGCNQLCPCGSGKKYKKCCLK